MSEAAIYVEDVRKSFGKVRALEGVSLEARAGKVFGLLGPNGAGKTTLVRILTTLLKLDSGEARVLGRDVTTDAEALRGLIGLAGQYAAVDENLTGRENLEMVGRLYHLGRREAKRRASGVLERFSLEDAADRPAKTYSGGMRRRLDLGASLVGEPQVLFLDEPTTGLDPRSRIEMWGLHQRTRGGRHYPLAHHPVPRRGRRVGRPHRRHRRRARDRRGHRGRTQIAFGERRFGGQGRGRGPLESRRRAPQHRHGRAATRRKHRPPHPARRGGRAKFDRSGARA